MFDLIEAPQPSKYAFEQNSVTIDTDPSEEKTENSGVTLFDSKVSELVAMLLERYTELIPRLIEQDDAEKARQREVTLNNLVHQADLKLRNRISLIMAAPEQSSLSKSAKQQLVQVINGLRKTILADLRHGDFDYVSELDDPDQKLRAVCEHFDALVASNQCTSG
eukprot:TRINITY_DN14956_c0_g1_i3.p1 TRINITY_DN14956_c0_g1~~TRINITY_DN14956_c0_g1_i3.p1  ORF type:complete len:165 (-),score=26.51 TRINITY_DN14956_c0_g1_i3:246-740(-)